MRPKSGRVLLAGGGVVASLLVGAQPSHAAAGTVSASGSVVTVTGTDAWEVVTITSSVGATRIEVDTSPDFTAGSGCAPDDDPTTRLIVCLLPSAGTVQVDMSGGGDIVRVGADSSPDTRLVVRGGPGHDALYGGPTIEEWYGDDGDDMITPDPSQPTQKGPDVVRGGPGRDQVNLGGFLASSITLDDQPNDTVEDVPGFDDLGSDVEVLAGGDGDDSFTGNDLAQVFDGGPGYDTIIALGGDDVVGGQLGDDRIDGGPGDDQLYGSEGDDTIVGGAGRDTVFGESGHDTVDTVDGEPDSVACGAGSDAANLDTLDTRTDVAPETCEAVTGGPMPTPAPAPVPTAPVPTAPPAPAPSVVDSTPHLKGSVLRADRHVRRTAVRVACRQGTTSCAGVLVVRSGGRGWGRGTYSLADDETARVRIWLNRRARTVLARRGAARVVVIAVDDSGTTSHRFFRLMRR
ncbi:calcium-binding protein [Nocardioides currus]|uniref:Calcium-binding protein n=1 Tax=Nocardioides currus TaxID=2133958 RepID=A0A2R7YXT4_9ACTN|nr:calcium-binding protein [Nocardioides currus]PUA81208.1 hypothetical protein C7S10_09215 [Nocardioides currus]